MYTANCVDDTIVIDVPDQGLLRGRRIQVDDELNILFFGKIPYVAPPLGDLRFARPGPPPSWEGEWDSTLFGPACPQLFTRLVEEHPLFDHEEMFSEDCLHMNIFAPEKTSGENKYPVMVFIHGGGYNGDSSKSAYTGETLAETQQVVIVTFNYRLGALGYLSTEDEAAYGNWGMWDQVAAMQWVKNNIELFNGDPDSITIFGQSAGAASVGLQMLSPHTEGLFHKALCQSGSPFNPVSVKLPPYSALVMAEELATKMNCPIFPTSELVFCLRSKDAFNLTYTAVTVRDDDQAAFMPVVDGPDNFLPDDPLVMMENGHYHRVPFMTGYTKTESATTAMRDVENPNVGLTREEFRDKIMARVTRRKYESCSNVSYEDIANAMEFYYTPWNDPNNPILLRDQYIKLESDSYIVAGVHYFAMHMFGDVENPKYMYRFDFKSQSGNYDDYVEVPHIEDIFFTFGWPFKPYSLMDLRLPLPWPYPEELARNFTDEDRVMSDTVMGLWANFAKYSDPTPDGHSLPGVNEKWTEYRASDKGIFHIDKESTMKRDDFVFHDVSFWHGYDPKVVQSATNICCECSNDPSPGNHPEEPVSGTPPTFNLLHHSGISIIALAVYFAVGLYMIL
ncbi:fatty acyl-CoA hydrolase precursor, medium chain-like [Glandiceps talaboti]